MMLLKFMLAALVLSLAHGEEFQFSDDFPFIGRNGGNGSHSLRKVCKEKGSCPDFQELYRDSDGDDKFIYRCYRNVTFAGVQVGTKNPTMDDYKAAAMKLISYTKGNNTEKRKVSMGLPIVTDSRVDLQKNSTEWQASLAFYINITNPPMALPGSGITVMNYSFCMYAKPFEADLNVTPETATAETEALYGILQKKNLIMPAPGYQLVADYSPGKKGYTEVAVIAPGIPPYNETSVFPKTSKKRKLKKFKRRCYQNDPTGRYLRYAIQIPNPTAEDFSSVYKKLNAYMLGENTEKKNIPFGAYHVIDTRIKNDSYYCAVSYYLPNGGPQPNDTAEVQLVNSPPVPGCVYVNKFDGDADESSVEKEIATLQKVLKKLKLTADDSVNVFLSYFNSGHNEVLLWEKK